MNNEFTTTTTHTHTYTHTHTHTHTLTAGEWKHWNTKVGDYIYPSDTTPEYNSILVPNVDNIRTDFLLETLAKQGKAVLLIGEQVQQRLSLQPVALLLLPTHLYILSYLIIYSCIYLFFISSKPPTLTLSILTLYCTNVMECRIVHQYP